VEINETSKKEDFSLSEVRKNLFFWGMRRVWFEY
jgi:hypothetical protein